MRWLVVLVVGVWAASLLVLGVPRVIASVLKAPAFSTLLAAERGERPPEERLEIATASLEQAMYWEKSGRVRGELGNLLLLGTTQNESASFRLLALQLVDFLFCGFFAILKGLLLLAELLFCFLLKGMNQGKGTRISRLAPDTDQVITAVEIIESIRDEISIVRGRDSNPLSKEILDLNPKSIL